jgi:hypothetical protein
MDVPSDKHLASYARRTPRMQRRTGLHIQFSLLPSDLDIVGKFQQILFESSNVKFHEHFFFFLACNQTHMTNPVGVHPP